LAEGSLASSLTTAIARGERRIQGHLLPQILAQQAGLAAAATLNMRRIQRIAVHPDSQQRGLGKQMLNQLYDYYCQVEQIDCLGASFAAEPEVVRFWLASGYSPVWAGQRLDSATALPSVQVVLPISQIAQEHTNLLQAHLFYYCLAIEPAWQSPLAKEINDLIRPSFKPVNTAFLADLIAQVGAAKGNVYAIKPYLYQRLLRAQELPNNALVWLDNYWQAKLTQKQFVALTRDLVVEWYDNDGDDLSEWC
jgi:tRNA(Met) C34 N-acetyltransferase TmcA